MTCKHFERSVIRCKVRAGDNNFIIYIYIYYICLGGECRWTYEYTEAEQLASHTSTSQDKYKSSRCTHIYTAHQGYVFLSVGK